MSLKEEELLSKYKSIIDKSKNQIAKILTTHRKLVTKLKKTYKNKLGSVQCEEVCKKEYLPEIEKSMDAFAKNIGVSIPHYNLAKDRFLPGALNGCKCAVCNENCKMPHMITITPPTTTTRTFIKTAKRSKK
jgi:hypothetical protein